MATINKNIAEFDVSLPDDTLWDEEGNPVVPGGRALAVRIRQALADRGWDSTDPSQHSFYGWSFQVPTPIGKAVVILQHPSPWLLIATRKPSFWKRLRGQADDIVDSKLIDALRDAIATDEHFSNVKWMSREEYFGSR
jgi:hypothetical protein